MPTRAELRGLPDSTLLIWLRAMPRHSHERTVICEILVERYTALVRSCVRQYRSSPESAEDLMQVGYIGLLKAINNFNPEIGDSLPAYAAPCISGEIKRHFRDRRWQIHVTRQAQELLLEMRAASEELGRAPADCELAVRLRVTEDDIDQARRAALVFSACSLDTPVYDRVDPAPLADLLGEDDHAVEHAIDMQAVQSLMEGLPQREQRILAMRFWGNFTQAEIGDRLGISQMHVSRLLSRVLSYLRDQLTGDLEGASLFAAEPQSKVPPR